MTSYVVLLRYLIILDVALGERCMVYLCMDAMFACYVVEFG